MGFQLGRDSYVQVSNRFSDLSFVPEPLLKMEEHTRNLLPRVAYRRAVFGEGVLVSRGPYGRALVSVVDGVNSVVQDVVTSVFNNSHFLDVHFSLHDQDVFYFVKVSFLRRCNVSLRQVCLYLSIF